MGAVSIEEQNSGCKYPRRESYFEHFLHSQCLHLDTQEGFAILLSLSWERLCLYPGVESLSPWQLQHVNSTHSLSSLRDSATPHNFLLWIRKKSPFKAFYIPCMITQANNLKSVGHWFSPEDSVLINVLISWWIQNETRSLERVGNVESGAW